jgi:hypothetical protein
LFLLKRNKLGRGSGTNTGTTVSNRLVGDGEFTKIVTSHLRLDFNLVEDLTVVNTNDGTNHLRDNDHVTEVGLDSLRLLTGRGRLLGSTELLDKTHRLALKTTLESSAGTTVDHLHELEKHSFSTYPSLSLFISSYLFGGQVQKLVEVSTAVSELTEGSLSLRSLISLYTFFFYI